jgi:hypothetical protein
MILSGSPGWVLGFKANMAANVSNDVNLRIYHHPQFCVNIQEGLAEEGLRAFCRAWRRPHEPQRTHSEPCTSVLVSNKHISSLGFPLQSYYSWCERERKSVARCQKEKPLWPSLPITYALRAAGRWGRGIFLPFR